MRSPSGARWRATTALRWIDRVVACGTAGGSGRPKPLTEALGGGGAASLRNDPLGKTFGMVLLDHPVSIPAAWSSRIDSGYLGEIAGY